jgi:hypothetical protein
LYLPGAPFGVPTNGSTSNDLNCDGIVEKENGVGQTSAFSNDVVTSVPLCSLADSCQLCSQRSTFGGGRWLDNNQPTSTQPRCSTSVSDGFPNQTSYYVFSATTPACGGEPNGWFSWVAGGLQLCR